MCVLLFVTAFSLYRLACDNFLLKEYDDDDDDDESKCCENLVIFCYNWDKMPGDSISRQHAQRVLVAKLAHVHFTRILVLLLSATASPRNRRRSPPPPPLRSQTETSRKANGPKPLTLRAAATVSLAV